VVNVDVYAVLASVSKGGTALNAALTEGAERRGCTDARYLSTFLTASKVAALESGLIHGIWRNSSS
jgi:hypothetical protein